MKTSGKPAAPMGRIGPVRRPPTVKVSKVKLGNSPACGHKAPKAGPDKGM
jgi:hypothetical protein